MIKNITLSVDDTLVQRARSRASREKRTLNSAFREWLARYAGEDHDLEGYIRMMNNMDYVKPDTQFTRLGD